MPGASTLVWKAGDNATRRDETREHTRAKTAVNTGFVQQGSSGGSVLLADPDGTRRAVVRRVLTLAGYRIVATCQISRVAAMAREQPWALAVIGEVPGARLESTCRTLAGHVPMVVLSDAVTSCRECWSRAACGAISLPPPVEPRTLLDAIDCALTATRLWRLRARVGPITLALDTDEIWVGDERRPNVKDVLYRLLRYLLLRPELSAQLAELEQDVWKARLARTTILSYVSRLRTALDCPDVRIVVVGNTCAVHIEPQHSGPAPAPARGRAAKATAGT